MKTRFRLFDSIRFWQATLGICLMVVPAALFGQNSLNIDSSSWSIQKCLDYAKINNIQLNSLRLDQQTTQQELLLSKAAVLPGLSVTAIQNLTHGKSLDANTGDGDRVAHTIDRG